MNTKTTSNKLTYISIIAVIVIGGFGLLGYVLELKLLSSINSEFIPMAPSTAISFILFGAILLFFVSNKQPLFRRWYIFIISIVSVFGFLKFVEYCIGLEKSFEEMIIGSTSNLGEIPVGIMSPATGAIFFLAGISILFKILSERNKSKNQMFSKLSNIFSWMVIIGSFTFILGYIYGNPILYKFGRIVPMALTTAVAFFLFGVALVNSNIKKNYLLSFLVRSSIQARLMQAFLPVIILAVISLDILSRFFPQIFVSKSDPIISSISVMVFIIITGLIIIRIGGELGKKLHKANEILRESEERYRLLFEKNTDGIVVVDINTKQFLYTNPAFYKMLGYTQKEILKLGVEDIHPKDKLDFIISKFNELSKGVSIQIVNIPCLRKDGEIIYIDINASLTIINDRKFNLGIFRDVTEKRLVEQLKQEKEINEKMLIRTQRLAALGELSSALAHEIRQPLHVIRMITEGIIYWDDKNEEKNEAYKKKLGNLSRVIKGIDRIDRVITNIYSHTRQSKEIKIEQVNFNLIIQETIDFFNAKLKYHSIKIIFNPDPEVLNILFYRSQAEQVITNLLSNAINALDKIDRNNKQISIKTQENNEYLLLEISDNGPGIDQKIKEKIFNPLFTTKQETDSLGMGLYIVHNILASFNGIIDVVNNESGGATFSIKFMRKQDKK